MKKVTEQGVAPSMQQHMKCSLGSTWAFLEVVANVSVTNIVLLPVTSCLAWAVEVSCRTLTVSVLSLNNVAQDMRMEQCDEEDIPSMMEAAHQETLLSAGMGCSGHLQLESQCIKVRKLL